MHLPILVCSGKSGPDLTFKMIANTSSVTNLPR